MTGQRNNIAHTPESWAAAGEKLRAERDANPQFAAMDKAYRHTKAELAEVEQAEAALRQAEEAVHAFLAALPRDPDAIASLTTSNLDLKELRLHAQNLRQRLNATVQRVNAARAERRRAAKTKFAPRSEVKAEAPRRLFGRKRAA